jgi:molybdopterin-guanine dinucleotide biosynthesis protein A
MSQRVGVVLAGGAGTRMGQPKGGIEVSGKTLAERAGGVLWNFCGSVICSHAAGDDNPAPSYPGVEDAAPAGRGPLAGIAAAFQATGQADLAVLACDYPCVDPGVYRRLLAFDNDSADLVMFIDADGRDHPLVGLWKRRTETRVRDALAAGFLRVRSLMPDFDVRRVGPADLPGVDLNRVLTNVNWPEDLSRLAGRSV